MLPTLSSKQTSCKTWKPKDRGTEETWEPARKSAGRLRMPGASPAAKLEMEGNRSGSRWGEEIPATSRLHFFPLSTFTQHVRISYMRVLYTCRQTPCVWERKIWGSVWHKYELTALFHFLPLARRVANFRQILLSLGEYPGPCRKNLACRLNSPDCPGQSALMS